VQSSSLTPPNASKLTICLFGNFLQIIINEPYGKSVDWWAYGVLIYEMLAGQVSGLPLKLTVAHMGKN